MSTQEFIERFGTNNDIWIRFSRSQDPEEDHPLAIQISWCDEDGQWWEGSTKAVAGTDLVELLLSSLAKRAEDK